MAWVEDRWKVKVTNDDGFSRSVDSPRNGTGLRWRVRYESPDGRERSKSFARKPDADNFCTNVGADLLRGTYLDPDAGKITLRKYAGPWLASQSFDATTLENTTNRLAHILAVLGDKRLDQLASSPSLIQAWVKGLNLASSTTRACFSILSVILGAAVDDGKIARNPCRARSIRLPAPDPRKVVPLEMPDLAALREALPGRYRAMIEAGAACGLRQGEIFGLAVEDVDFLRHVVHVGRQAKVVNGRIHFALPKRGKSRDIPLPGAAASAFAEHLREFPAARVTLPWHEPGNRRHGTEVTVRLMFFTPQARSALDRHRFNVVAWKPALRTAGIPDVRENGMHVLRHSYASMLLAGGADIKRVASCLGHEDPAFTLRVYAHLMQGGEERVRNIIDSAFAVPVPAPLKIIQQ